MTHLLRYLLRAFALATAAHAQPAPAAVPPVLYPDWAPLLNVKKFGAVGDGKTDDTDAIQRTIQARKTDGEVYFPPGVYLVSKPLVGLDAKGNPLGWLQFYGAGKGHSCIRLKDRCEGFQDEKAPLAVVRFRGNITKESGTAREQPNVAFFNSVYDLTIDVGVGNAGAVGIDWVACNGGTLRHVNVVSSDPERRGFAGVRMAANDGTSYVHDLGILGFDYGWWRGAHAQCLAVEGLHLKGQRTAGIFNKNSVFALHGLRSENSVPTLIQAEAVAQASILSARITGGASPAFVQRHRGALLHLRDVRAEGSSVLVQSPSAPALAGPQLAGEWFSHPAASPGQPASLGLPIKLAPEFHSNDARTWARVAAFPDDGTGDFSARLQKAIDSGAETIVMDVQGTRKYRSPVTVRGRVKRIIGFWQSSLPAKDATFDTSRNALLSIATSSDAMSRPEQWFLHLEGGGTEPLIIEQFHHFPGGVLNNSTRPVVLRDMVLPAYANTARATGEVFIEGVCGANYRICHGQRAWFRSVDAVFGAHPDITVDRSTAWILSNRTEGGGVFVEAKNGASVEIIGTTHFIGSHGVGDGLAYVSRDSDFSLVNFSEFGFGKAVYETLVATFRNGQETRLERKSPGVIPRLGRHAIMLYRSASRDPTARGPE